jgi:hypothetical protein
MPAATAIVIKWWLDKLCQREPDVALTLRRAKVLEDRLPVSVLAVIEAETAKNG